LCYNVVIAHARGKTGQEKKYFAEKTEKKIGKRSRRGNQDKGISQVNGPTHKS